MRLSNLLDMFALCRGDEFIGAGLVSAKGAPYLIITHNIAPVIPEYFLALRDLKTTTQPPFPFGVRLQPQQRGRFEVLGRSYASSRSLEHERICRRDSSLVVQAGAVKLLPRLAASVAGRLRW
jgi:hypothetical protein